MALEMTCTRMHVHASLLNLEVYACHMQRNQWNNEVMEMLKR